MKQSEVLDTFDTINLDKLNLKVRAAGWSYVNGCVYERGGLIAWLTFEGDRYTMRRQA